MIFAFPCFIHTNFDEIHTLKSFFPDRVCYGLRKIDAETDTKEKDFIYDHETMTIFHVPCSVELHLSYSVRDSHRHTANAHTTFIQNA